MAKKEPPRVITKIVRGDAGILYDSLHEQEKAAFAERMNRRAIRAIAQAHGYTAEFSDDASDIGLT